MATNNFHGEDAPGYVFQEYPKDLGNGVIVKSRAEEDAVKAKNLPTAADLDSVEGEKKVVEATTPPKKWGKK